MFLCLRVSFLPNLYNCNNIHVNIDFKTEKYPLLTRLLCIEHPRMHPGRQPQKAPPRQIVSRILLTDGSEL